MKWTITWRFVALSTVVVALIFVLFNTFVYLEFMNVTIDSEKQVVAARVSDVVRRIQGDTVPTAIVAVKGVVPDIRQMVRLLSSSGAVLTSSDASFVPSWIPKGLGNRTNLGHGVILFQHEEQRILMASAYVRLRGGAVTVQWLENVESLDNSIAFVFYLLLTGSIGGLVLAALASYFLARYSLQPIREMIATARAITPGDLSSRIDVPKRQDELTELGHTFNAMLDRITLAFFRERQFIADASHELRTPLSVLEGYVHLLRGWGWDDSGVREEAIQAIEEEVTHLRTMADQLLVMATVEEEATEAVTTISAAEVAERVVRKWMRVYPTYDWSLTVDEAAITRVHILEVRLEQVLRALLDNVRKYTPLGHKVWVCVRRIESVVEIIVGDAGQGIPPEDLPYVTQRFYRADKSRNRREGGVGLGLAICRGIIEAADGQLTVQSVLHRGTEVHIMLPANEDERT